MKFYGELLIFVLLLITNLRVFFVNHVRRDPLVVMAPLTFIITILQIISWGIDFFTLTALIISLLVLFSNFHAIFRYIEELYIDHYSLSMKIWSVITILISLFAIMLLILFAPIEINSRKMSILENKTRYKGSFNSGFELTNSFSTSNIVFYQFENDQRLEENPQKSKEIIMFIPDKRGETYNYKPYLQLLSKEGYTVCSADFFVDDLKDKHKIDNCKVLQRELLILKSLKNQQWFMLQREFYTYNITRELEALDKILHEKFGADIQYYLISDVMGNTAISEFYKNHKNEINSFFTLDSIPDYKTVGYGCIEQTNPLLASLFGLNRDKSLKTPKLLVKKTIEIL